MEKLNILEVTTKNVAEVGIYCIKDKKAPGYAEKIKWFKQKINEGLVIKIAHNAAGKQLGFIEYLPSEKAWRPVNAKNYLFIQCIGLFVKEAKQKGIGSLLLGHCEAEARRLGKAGICAMSSDGPWIANKSLYEKNGFVVTERKDRFELMVKKFNSRASSPVFFNWTEEQLKYKGWNLVYSHQCPWHEKSVNDLSEAAKEHGLKLNIKKLETPQQAQKSPSGFGTFSLLYNGRLLVDHYISRTRFENILKQELNNKK